MPAVQHAKDLLKHIRREIWCLPGTVNRLCLLIHAAGLQPVGSISLHLGLLQPALDQSVSQAGFSHCVEALCLQETTVGLSLRTLMPEMHCQSHNNAHKLHLNAQHEQPGPSSEDKSANKREL